MSEERIAGQYVAIDIDRHMEMSAKFNARDMAFRELGGRIKRQFPACAECKNLEMHEAEDPVRYVKKFAVTCKSKPSFSSRTMTCPDGVVGRIDEKEKKFMVITQPKVTFPEGLDEYVASLTSFKGKDEFMREYMTTPSIAEDKDVMRRVMAEKEKVEGAVRESLLRDAVRLETKTEGVGKISAGLKSFGPGSTTGYTRSDARFTPNTFNADRPAGVKAAPKVNRDAPVTTDGDAW